MEWDKAGAAEREAYMGGTNLTSGGFMETVDEKSRERMMNDGVVAPVDRTVRINRAIVAAIVICLCECGDCEGFGENNCLQGV